MKGDHLVSFKEILRKSLGLCDVYILKKKYSH